MPLTPQQRTARARKAASERWAKATITQNKLPQVSVKAADLIAHSLTLLEILDAAHRKALIAEWRENSPEAVEYFTGERLKDIALIVLDLAEDKDRTDRAA